MTARPSPPGRPAAVTSEFYWRAVYDPGDLLGYARGRNFPPVPDPVTRLASPTRHPLPYPPQWNIDGRDPAGRLATLLHYGYGLSRVEFRADGGLEYHRFVASARCLYPVEIYVFAGAGTGVAAGPHHYDPHRHDLTPARSQGRASVPRRPATGCFAVLVLTVVLHKTAFRYGPYAHRLCAQETGMVAGNVLLVAAALGLAGQVAHRPRSAAAHRLLGVTPPAEAIGAVVTLHAPTGSATTGEPSMLRDPASALRARRSGPGAFVVAAHPLPLSLLCQLLDHATAPHVSDAVPGTGRPPVECFVVANRVAGLAPGGYRFDTVRRVLLPRRPGDLAAALQDSFDATDRPAPIDYRTPELVVYLVVDTVHAAAVAGGDGSRILTQEAGVVAQRISVLAAEQGRAARVHNGYAAGRVADLLRLDRTRHIPVFQLLIGVLGPTAGLAVRVAP